jgi:hypothetical protein
MLRKIKLKTPKTGAALKRRSLKTNVLAAAAATRAEANFVIVNVADF